MFRPSLVPRIFLYPLNFTTAASHHTVQYFFYCTVYDSTSRAPAYSQQYSYFFKVVLVQFINTLLQ